jgi:4-hydroxy-tetrahydrodipicolinate synthase
MMRSLDRNTLKGLWSAVPTPWNSDGDLVKESLLENCRRLVEAGVDGIYTTDSDGEFYAIEIEEFRQLAEVFGRAVESLKIDAAMGVTWSHTRGVIDRIRASLDAGIPNVHIALPYYMPLAKGDVDRFFDDLFQAVPQARWIHYAHPKSLPVLTGADYARLSKRYPEQLIGTKLAASNMTELIEIILRSPELAHFVVDPILVVGMMFGARGCYSYWVNTLPRWHRSYMDACCERRWDHAVECHKKLMDWELTHIKKLRDLGHYHGIIGKTRAALTGFLEDTGLTRAPYYAVASEIQKELARAFKTFWSEEIIQEKF